MLRTIAISVGQAIAIVLGAELCWSLLAYFIAKDSFDIAPLVILALYPLPVGVAALRRHSATLDIIVFNMWLGWTVIGWFVALVWACNLNVEATAE